MNAETFLNQFGHLADAPNGVQKLRELVLQLAVRGKLVEQSVTDERAADCLARLSATKAEAIKSKAIQADKELSPVVEPSPPFEIPSTWAWLRLQDLFEVSRGGSPRPAGDPRYFRGEIPWITVREITKDGEMFLSGVSGGITLLGAERSRFIMPDDLLLTNSGATLGVPKISRIRGCINDGVALLRCFHDEIAKPYAYFYLLSQTSAFRAVNQGMGQPNLNTSIIAAWHFPLPPLTEQHRIVAKVDELLALCDELETQQARRTVVRTAFAAASLARLTAAPTPAETAGEWSRVAQHFDTLFAVPQTIPQLRQTILQLAVTGRLVEQNPGDEAAEKLVDRISVERSRLIQTGAIPKEKPIPPIASADTPFEVPESWRWVRFGRLAKVVEYGTGEKADSVSTGVPTLRMNNVRDGKVHLDDLKYVREGIKGLPQLLLRHGDILFNRTNSFELVGKAGMFEGADNTYCFASYLIRATLFADMVDPRFINCAMNAEYFRRTQINPNVTQQCGQANFNGTKLRQTLIPLPPLTEQRRIVSKVNDLMKVCDALEAQLTARQGTAERLTAAMVQALLEGAAHEPAAEPMPRDPQQDRAAIAARIVQRLHERPHFGSVHFAKVFYTAVTHTGLNLGITFHRQKAGPLWTGLYALRNAGQRDGWLRYTKAAADGEPDRYQPGPQIAPLLQYGEHLLASRAADFDRILDLFSALDTRRAELIATAYAVWNDFLLAGETPSDARIVKDFRENWHSEKAKFPASEIRQGLAWLREHGLTPAGRGTATTPQ